MIRARTCTAVALCAAGALAPAASSAQERFVERLALRLELGGGVMLSPFQRNTDPVDYAGNTKGLRSVALDGAVRFALRLFEPLSFQVSLSNWVFPSTTEFGTGWVFALMGGLRVEPRVGSAGRFFLDANLGVGYTGALRRLVFDVGVGFEFDASRAFALGPFVRYGHTVQPDTYDDGTAEPFPQDARYLVAGLSMSFHVPPRAQLATAAEAPPPPPPPPPLGRPDANHDGVFDSDDFCPTVPQGSTPDPARAGCPSADTDGDGVFDHGDQCVTTPQGDRPDPARPGCPSVDADRDGVADNADACPTVPRGPRPDPARPGCPALDADGDGIFDAADQCPDRAETFNNYQDTDGCPDRPPLVTIVDGMIRILGTINFVSDSDRIVGSRSFDILDSIVTFLAAHSELARVEVQGHTDDVGTREHNLALSQRRASAVRFYLIEHQIGQERLDATGYGPDRPVTPNRDAITRAQNRRVELQILRYADGTVPPGAPTPAR